MGGRSLISVAGVSSLKGSRVHNHLDIFATAVDWQSWQKSMANNQCSFNAKFGIACARHQCLLPPTASLFTIIYDSGYDSSLPVLETLSTLKLLSLLLLLFLIISRAGC